LCFFGPVGIWDVDYSYKIENMVRSYSGKFEYACQHKMALTRINMELKKEIFLKVKVLENFIP
jgi:hypothetical protein